MLFRSEIGHRCSGSCLNAYRHLQGKPHAEGFSHLRAGLVDKFAPIGSTPYLRVCVATLQRSMDRLELKLLAILANNGRRETGRGTLQDSQSVVPLAVATIGVQNIRGRAVFLAIEGRSWELERGRKQLAVLIVLHHIASVQKFSFREDLVFRVTISISRMSRFARATHLFSRGTPKSWHLHQIQECRAPPQEPPWCHADRTSRAPGIPDCRFRHRQSDCRSWS